MTNFPTILNRLTGMFSEDRADFIASFDEYDLLIIDDLGVERSTEYAMEQMFFVIDSRYRSRRPMIITTNLKLAELKNPPDLCLTAKTGMGSCAPNRKRHWKNLALNCLIRVSPRANTTIENKPLMQYAARCSLTSAANMGCIWSRSRPMVGGRIWRSRTTF